MVRQYESSIFERSKQVGKITSVLAREILDSRGHPTLQVEVTLNDEFMGIAQVPSGASRGSNEAFEKRDAGATRYRGKGVLGAVHTVNQEIFAALANKEVACTGDLDETLLSMDDYLKSNLGGNATIGVSMAAAHALANEARMELYQYLANANGRDFFMPVPFVNLINGGRHARNHLMVQEFMIVPSGFESFREAIRCACEVFYTLGDLCDAGGVGDEGGYAPNLEKPEEALDLLMLSVDKAGYMLGDQVHFALDIAASELLQNGLYQVDKYRQLDVDGLVELYQNLCSNYPLISIEDPMDQHDLAGWKKVTQKLSGVQVIGDDIFCTQKNLLSKGMREKCANAILIKPNQVGTITETLDAVDLAQSGGYKTMISHRSGETGDTTISDLAVGTGSMQIKSGSVCRFERVAKYNRILEIEEKLGNMARYAGEVLKWT